MPAPPELLSFIDASAPAFIARLGEAVAIPSISGEPLRRPAAKSGTTTVAREDGWASEPFVLTELADGKLVGRGSSDDKGPVLGWVNVLQWHHGHKKELPVNLVFCFEGMEESGSEGLDALVEQEKDAWFKDVDCVARILCFLPCRQSRAFASPLQARPGV
ncbi:hypothetical protein C8J57DRAFT_1705304 [Mycena rebaudengoi]|nr:hypothetical protein C8J57DRAFT_1705304 [Mycena rebaudengoi]